MLLDVAVFRVLHSVYQLLSIVDGGNKTKLLFDKMDINKDGVVDHEEFIYACQTVDDKMVF